MLRALRRRFQRGVFAGVAAFCLGPAFGASDRALVSTLPCFHAKVRIESVCRSLGQVYAECERQTLKIGSHAVPLIGTDPTLHAYEWSCSEDQKLLFVHLANGGNCTQCEQSRTFGPELESAARHKRRIPEPTPIVFVETQ